MLDVILGTVNPWALEPPHVWIPQWRDEGTYEQTAALYKQIKDILTNRPIT
jgi:hypothetical protein